MQTKPRVSVSTKLCHFVLSITSTSSWPYPGSHYRLTLERHMPCALKINILRFYVATITACGSDPSPLLVHINGRRAISYYQQELLFTIILIEAPWKQTNSRFSSGHRSVAPSSPVIQGLLYSALQRSTEILEIYIHMVACLWLQLGLIALKGRAVKCLASYATATVCLISVSCF